MTPRSRWQTRPAVGYAVAYRVLLERQRTAAVQGSLPLSDAVLYEPRSTTSPGVNSTYSVALEGTTFRLARRSWCGLGITVTASLSDARDRDLEDHRQALWDQPGVCRQLEAGRENLTLGKLAQLATALGASLEIRVAVVRRAEITLPERRGDQAERGHSNPLTGRDPAPEGRVSHREAERQQRDADREPQPRGARGRNANTATTRNPPPSRFPIARNGLPALDL